jgi:hypothetical protein
MLSSRAKEVACQNEVEKKLLYDSECFKNDLDVLIFSDGAIFLLFCYL